MPIEQRAKTEHIPAVQEVNKQDNLKVQEQAKITKLPVFDSHATKIDLARQQQEQEIQKSIRERLNPKSMPQKKGINIPVISKERPNPSTTADKKIVKRRARSKQATEEVKKHSEHYMDETSADVAEILPEAERVKAHEHDEHVFFEASLEPLEAQQQDNTEELLVKDKPSQQGYAHEYRQDSKLYENEPKSVDDEIQIVASGNDNLEVASIQPEYDEIAEIFGPEPETGSNWIAINETAMVFSEQAEQAMADSKLEIAVQSQELIVLIESKIFSETDKGQVDVSEDEVIEISQSSQQAALIEQTKNEIIEHVSQLSEILRLNYTEEQIEEVVAGLIEVKLQFKQNLRETPFVSDHLGTREYNLGKISAAARQKIKQLVSIPKIIGFLAIKKGLFRPMIPSVPA